MALYLLKRILVFIPTLVLISLLAFILTLHAPGDPVEKMMGGSESFGTGSAFDERQRREWVHRLGLDLPVFYFSIQPLSWPDTLFRISSKAEREAAKAWLRRCGNTGAVLQFRNAVNSLVEKQNQSLREIPAQQYSSWRDSVLYSRNTLLAALATSDPAAAERRLRETAAACRSNPRMHRWLPDLDSVVLPLREMTVSSHIWKNYIPSFRWHGNNQYHRWIFGDGNWLTGKGSTFSKGLIRGDLGLSWYHKLPVSSTIGRRIGWSLLFTVLSVVFAYLISIPAGIRSAMHPGSFFDKTSTFFFFLLYSLPSFWVSLLLLMVFANDDVWRLFPSTGVSPPAGYPDDAGFLEKVRLSLPYLVLPLLAYTYSSFAFLSRLTRGSMLEVMQQDYIRTARAKGLKEKTVVYKHAFRNALLPLITVLANILPAAMGGSVIIESIFGIPGMGLETFNAIHRQDVPMIVGVFTVTGVLTLAGYLLADMLYAVADPRITYSGKRAT